MSQGLKKHWCQYYEDYSYTRYDADRKCDKRVTVYRCMICGREHKEVYYMQHKELKYKACKALERNRNKHHG